MKKYTSSTCVRLEESTLKRIKEISIEKRRKESELMRIIIEDYIKAHDM